MQVMSMSVKLFRKESDTAVVKGLNVCVQVGAGVFR